ncbi:uncharacterized protein [Danio rerio]|uniref:Uncharacterized protein n=1 Tax=Danio rerio TaxID=7955 RepID=A0AB32TTM0_DANRE
MIVDHKIPSNTPSTMSVQLEEDKSRMEETMAEKQRKKSFFKLPRFLRAGQKNVHLNQTPENCNDEVKEKRKKKSRLASFLKACRTHLKISSLTPNKEKMEDKEKEQKELPNSPDKGIDDDLLCRSKGEKCLEMYSPIIQEEHCVEDEMYGSKTEILLTHIDLSCGEHEKEKEDRIMEEEVKDKKKRKRRRRNKEEKKMEETMMEKEEEKIKEEDGRKGRKIKEEKINETMIEKVMDKIEKEDEKKEERKMRRRRMKEKKKEQRRRRKEEKERSRMKEEKESEENEEEDIEMMDLKVEIKEEEMKKRNRKKKISSRMSKRMTRRKIKRRLRR